MQVFDWLRNLITFQIAYKAWEIACACCALCENLQFAIEEPRIRNSL